MAECPDLTPENTQSDKILTTKVNAKGENGQSGNSKSNNPEDVFRRTESKKRIFSSKPKESPLSVLNVHEPNDTLPLVQTENKTTVSVWLRMLKRCLDALNTERRSIW